MNTVPSSYGNHKEALGLRPNTALPTEFFQDDMIICTGEDVFELECAMRTSLAVEIPVPHQYRCYRAWKYDGLTVILSTTYLFLSRYYLNT